MTAAPPDGRLDRAQLLLRDLDRIEATLADRERETAELAQGVLDAVEQLSVIFHQEPRPVGAETLFVGERAEEDVPSRSESLGLCPKKGGNHHRDAALHVDRPSAPDVPVDELALEGRMGPLLIRGGHNVDVPVEQERCGVAPAWKAGDQVRSLRVARPRRRLAPGF